MPESEVSHASARGSSNIVISSSKHPSSSSSRTRRHAAHGSHSAIDETIQHPGTVRINVQGAFIVPEEEPTTPQSDDYEHDPRDIRLPNHTAIVSHVAVDVSLRRLSYSHYAC
jgi:type II pantothenate kinase